MDEEKKVRLINVNPHNLTEELQKSSGSQAMRRDDRSVEFPKTSWIKKSLQILVLAKMADGPDPVSGVYTIHWKIIRGDTFEYFVKIVQSVNKKPLKTGSADAQLRLPLC